MHGSVALVLLLIGLLSASAYAGNANPASPKSDMP